MKRLTLFICLIILFSIPMVNASECPNAEKVDLSKIATSVKVGWKEETGIRDSSDIVPPDGYDPEEYVEYYNYFVINFFNITEDIYIKLENKESKKQYIINYKDTDNGSYSLDWYAVNRVNNFSYSIIATNKTNCYETVLKTGLITLPAYNPYHVHSKCEGHEDYPLCQKYINANITYNEFIKKLDKYLESLEEEKLEEEKKETSIFTTIFEFIKENKTIILVVTGIVVLVGGFVIGLVIRKRRSRAI